MMLIDFERCIALLDPIKGENKSPESWQTFLFRFRQALIAAFSRALTKFEEVVRTQREHRNELNWNFCNYFLLQVTSILIMITSSLSFFY